LFKIILLLFINNFFIFDSTLNKFKMKKIYQLKSLLDLVIVFSMIIIGFTLIGLLYGLLTGNLSKWDFSIQGQKIHTVDAALGILIILIAIGYGFFMYSIFQLKKLVTLFIKKEFFTDLSVKTLKAIGVTMLGSSLLIAIPNYLYGIFGNADFKITIASLSPASMIFTFIMALFFIILSSIFKEAKIIKDENELTI